MFPGLKNSYLHGRVDVDPRIINRSIDKARGFEKFDQFDDFHPFHRLTSEQPDIPIEQFDVTRRPVAFGHWAMPILRRDLHHEKHNVILQTLNSLIDILHDPERNIEGINLKIPDRLADLLENEDPAVRERACMALTIMANLLQGKYAVVKNKRILKNLSHLLYDPDEFVRFKAINLIEVVSEVWMAADYLVDKGFIELIINRVTNCEITDPCFHLYLKALENLMYCNGKTIGLENNLFEILMNLLDKVEEPPVIGSILKDLSILMQTKEGLELAIKHKLLKELYRYLHDDRVEIYENAACALIFLTIHCKAIVKSLKLKNFIERLILLAKNHLEPVTQRYCLQVLGNLGAHRTYKLLYVNKYLKEIESIYVGRDEQAQRFKSTIFEDLHVF